MKCLFNLKMIEGGSVIDHLNEFNTITSQLTFVNVTFDEEVRALLILCSLPKSWNSLVMVVSKFFSGLNKLKIDDVIGIIISEEMQQKSIGESSTLGNALTIENMGRKNQRGKSPKNHGKSQGKSKKGRSKARQKRDFWHYGKLGHLKKDC